MSALNLQQLFRPKSVAILGASEKNPWGAMALGVLDALRFDGPVHLVNRRGGTVMGRSAVTAATEIGEAVDAAFVAVPAQALYETIEEMAAAGIKHGVVVSSGFAETGPEGAAEQARVAARARELGITLMGPNSLGFINFVDRVGLGALPIYPDLLPEPRVGLVSQSGATAGILTRSAHRNNVSLSHAIAVGNEAQVGLAEAVSFLVEDESTRAIAIFAESVRDPAAFLPVAARAFEAKKPIAMLKVGVGELAAAVAQAHTGALVGDNRIFEAMCKQYGVVRVDTLEELITVADFLAFAGIIPAGKKFAVASISGGACEMIADRGDDAGVPFAHFNADSVERLKKELPVYAVAHNPLDITGAAMAEPDLFRRALVAIGGDPEVGLVGACFELPVSEGDVSSVSKPALTAIARGFKEAGLKGFLLQQTMQPITAFSRNLAAETGIPYIASGLGLGMRAVGATFAWSEKVREGLERHAPQAKPIDARPRNERATLDMLAEAGVPVIAARVAGSRREAEDSARALGEPVVLKILSADIQHKTEAGGVALNLNGAREVGDAYDAMLENVSRRAPKAKIDGVIVSPMRTGGVELFVGVARDPSWGLALAVGFGGVLVELLQDTTLRLLPASPRTVKAMLSELRGARLLQGYRGGEPVDVDKLADVVSRIGDVALAMGPELASLEINPLWVCGDRVECLDALAVWSQ